VREPGRLPKDTDSRGVGRWEPPPVHATINAASTHGPKRITRSLRDRIEHPSWGG